MKIKNCMLCNRSLENEAVLFEHYIKPMAPTKTILFCEK